jgi:FMN phosphatase YigB (HAD superfamily)
VTRTLLFDLDDTLLKNDINSFVPVYSRALGKQFATLVEPQRLVQSLLQAIGVMMQNQEIDHTLLENFNSAFYPALGLQKEDVQGLIDDFYAKIFPTLQELTQPIPEAVEVIQEAFRRGYRVGIATNPLFPRTAILQRLEWAGLSAERYPYILVPSIEFFHFAKPNPAFFAEYLAKLSWPEGPVIMVGNDLDHDIRAARKMGLSAYWIRPDRQLPVEDSFGPNASGDYPDLLHWLDTASEESIQPDYGTPIALNSILLSTPAYLRSLSEMLPANQWLIQPKPGEWCLAEIVCHLRDVENEVNLPRLKKIMENNNPFLPGMDTDPWAIERQYISQDCLQALDAFILARKELLHHLSQIQMEDWGRTARHAILGPTRLQEMINIIANHDRLHVQQAQQAIRDTSN